MENHASVSQASMFARIDLDEVIIQMGFFPLVWVAKRDCLTNGSLLDSYNLKAQS
jgi:hypothetical protein